MSDDNRRMRHSGGEQQDGQMGYYEFSEIPQVQESIVMPVEVSEPVQVDQNEPTMYESVQSTQRRSRSQGRSLGDKLKTGWKVTKSAVVVAGVLLVAREVSNFGLSFDAHEKAEVAVGPAENVVRENVYVNLAEVSSTFPLKVKTSLDRPGPANCDMSISMNQKGHEVTTITNTGLIFESVETAKQADGTYQVDVSGDMKMAPSYVDWTKTPIQFDRELAGLDLCFNMDEPNAAMNIAVVTTQLAGQLATACAVGSKEGEKAIIAGIKEDERQHGNIPAAISDEQITVNFPDLKVEQDAVYGRAVQSFDKGVDSVIDKYIDSSKDHDIKTNFDGIRDCSQHTFTFEDK